MKKCYFFILLMGTLVNAQLTLPYTNDFNHPVSDDNWTHYAVSGSDDWGRGLATGMLNTTDFSWETKLAGTPTVSSNMALESPAFNLTNANLPYVLQFKYKSSLNSGNLYLEYTIDNGVTWLLLNPTTTLKKNWQSTAGFSLTTNGNITTAAINLSFLQGNGNVKFRFRCKTNASVSGYGWIIDNFSIAPESYNVYAGSATPLEISPLCPQLAVNTILYFDNQYTVSYQMTTKYYVSTDTVLDVSDTLIGTYTTNFGSTLSSYNNSFATPPNLTPGQYYIIYQHDATNVLAESSETDNIGYCSLVVRSIFNLPYSNDFEAADSEWRTNIGANVDIPLMWERSSGTRHHLEKAHSGVSAWHTSKTIIEHPDYTFQCVESPYFNLSGSAEPLYLSFWFKADYADDNAYKVQYALNCSASWTDLAAIPRNTSDEWENYNIALNATVSASPNVRFRISYQSSYQEPEGIIFDDFYLGPIKPDLTIEGIYSNKRFTSANSQTDVLKYQIRNSGSNMTQSATTRFYWSTDAVLDGSDFLLGEQSIASLATGTAGMWMLFNYTKPTTAAGNYFILYVLDYNNQILEIRENNNTGGIPIEQLATYSFPYYNDFETDANNWSHEATLGQDNWAYGTPNGEILDTAFSGNKALISNAVGAVPSMSRMHFYSPVFNLSTSVNPVLEFDMKLDNFGGCSCYELTANLSYSTDNGATWTVLEPVNNSYSKWSTIQKYNENNALDEGYMTILTEKMFGASEKGFANHTHYNSRDIDRNTKYMIHIPQLQSATNVRFRYNLSTMINDGQYLNENGRLLEGAMIDNFQIREAEVDLNVPYTKNLYVSSLSNKIRFSIDVKNSGNYISNATDIKFYLSADNIYNSGDHYLGNATLAQIRPDFKSNKIMEFTAPANLSNYNYLIYVIDDANANVEISEVNNQGAWPLGLSGITQFPYSENFEGDVVNGWKGYAYDDFSSTVLTNYRVTNKIAVSDENNFFRKLYNGVLRTEKVPYGSWQDYLTPMYYIETPAFNFTTYNSIEPLIMAFDLMSIGSNFRNGGNMQYSINGGTTWNLLTVANGATFNWYPDFYTMSDFGEPGWFGYEGEIKSVKMNISFLQNQSNVIFRYKYFSNYSSADGNPAGLRIDNFSIGQESLVSDLNCFENVPYMMSFDNTEITCWEYGTNDDEIILLERTISNDIHWEIGNNFANVPNNSAAKINLSGQGNTNGVWFISPKFNMVSGNKLKFNIALNQFGNFNSAQLDTDDKVILKYSTNNGFTWTDLITWTNTSTISNTAQQVLVNSLPSTGYVQFAFWATNGTTSGNPTTFYVDDFALYTGPLGISEHESLNLTYYPNPVSDVLNISTSSEEITHVDLYTVSGQLLETVKINSINARLDLKSYSSGAYFVKVNSKDRSKTIKILK